MPGLIMGNTTLKKVRSSPAPSTRAASRISSGTCIKAWRSMKMPKALVAWGRIKDQ